MALSDHSRSRDLLIHKNSNDSKMMNDLGWMLVIVFNQIK